MLSRSYAAIQQFQSQISSVKDLKKLKELSKSLGLCLSFEVTSSCFWKLIWEATENKFSGVVELGILPVLGTPLERFEPFRPRTFRLEQPSFVDLKIFESCFLDLAKESILSIPKGEI